MRRLLFLLPLSLLLGACGGSSSPSGGGPVLQTIQISETEYSLSPGTVTISKTGTYEFRVTNKGSIAHALVWADAPTTTKEQANYRAAKIVENLVAESRSMATLARALRRAENEAALPVEPPRSQP